MLNVQFVGSVCVYTHVVFGRAVLDVHGKVKVAIKCAGAILLSANMKQGETMIRNSRIKWMKLSLFLDHTVR